MVSDAARSITLGNEITEQILYNLLTSICYIITTARPNDIYQKNYFKKPSDLELTLLQSAVFGA